MDLTIWMYLVVILFLNELIESKTLYCKPGRKYFNPLLHRCQRCPDECPDGQTLNKSMSLNTSKEFGALNCYPCIKCPDGMFSNGDSQGKCWDCYNCTATEYRYTIFECNGTRDTECGDCLPDFYEMTPMRGIGPCKTCSESTGNNPKCGINTSQIPYTTTHQTKATTTPGYVENILNHISASNLIIVICVCIAAFFGIIFVFYKMYKCIQKTIKGGHENFGTYSTVATALSDEILKPVKKFPENQDIPQNDLETDGVIVGEILSEAEINTRLSLDDKCLRFVARYTDKPTGPLYDSLNVDGAKRHNLNKQYGADPMEEQFQVLKYWVSKEGDDATFGRLYTALKNGGYILACDKLLETLRKKQSNVSVV